MTVKCNDHKSESNYSVSAVLTSVGFSFKGNFDSREKKRKLAETMCSLTFHGQAFPLLIDNSGSTTVILEIMIQIFHATKRYTPHLSFGVML